jgi:hypothetical protein
MKIRATIWAMLAVVLSLSLGAQAGERAVTRVNDLYFSVNIDSSQYCDTAISITFGVGDYEFSEIVGKVFRITADSIFSKDSVNFVLQTKFDDDYDSTWYSILTTGLFEDGEEDDPGGKAVSVQMSDSSASTFDAFRWLMIFSTADDSTGDHGATFDWNAKYRAYLKFRMR